MALDRLPDGTVAAVGARRMEAGAPPTAPSVGCGRCGAAVTHSVGHGHALEQTCSPHAPCGSRPSVAGPGLDRHAGG